MLLLLAALTGLAGCRRSEPLKADETPCPFLAGPEVRDFRGAMCESGFLYGFHVVYRADREFVLDHLAALPVDASAADDVGPGDERPVPVGRDEAMEHLFEPETFVSLGVPHPDRARGPAYRFFRFPWTHTLVFDGDTGMVYHYISEVRP